MQQNKIESNQSQPIWSPQKFSRHEFLKACWDYATIVAYQSWSEHGGNYPGHEPGEPTKMQFGVLSFHQRLLLLVENYEEYEDNEEYEDDEDNVASTSICVCANLPSSWTKLEEAMELQKFDGWHFNWKVSALPDKDCSRDLENLITRFYSPLPGSDLDAIALLELASQPQKSRDYQYVFAANGTICMSAIASYRTGVTTGSFIYDEAVIEILQAFNVAVEKLLFVKQSNIRKDVVNELISRSQNEKCHLNIKRLESELNQAEMTAARLRSEIELQKRILQKYNG